MQIQQETTFAHLKARSGLIKLNSGEHIVHKTISDYVEVCIRYATTYILSGLTTREHIFYSKQLKPRINETIAATAASNKTITTVITTFTEKRADLNPNHKQLHKSIEQIITQNNTLRLSL